MARRGRMAAGAALALFALCRAHAGSEVLIDNSLVRVSLNTYVPGEPSGEHEHLAPRFVYVLTDGALKSIAGSDPPDVVNMVAGSCMYAPPVRHSVQNAGDTILRMIEIELSGARGTSDGRIQRCPQRVEREMRPSRVERDVLFAGADFVASRIVIPPGSKDKAGSIRGPRLVFVLEGRSLASRQAGGSKAIATKDAALWVDEEAPLINLDTDAPLVVLEVTPNQNNGKAASR